MYYCGLTNTQSNSNKLCSTVNSQCSSCIGKCKITPQCNNKHEMQLFLSQPEEYNDDDNNITCNMCKKSNICNNNRYIYHCKSCSYDLCDNCTMTMKII